MHRTMIVVDKAEARGGEPAILDLGEELIAVRAEAAYLSDDHLLAKRAMGRFWTEAHARGETYATYKDSVAYGHKDQR